MPIRRRTPAWLLAAALVLAACGGDDTTAEAPPADEQDIGEVADEAKEQLDDAGVSTDRQGTAEVTFLGETLEFTAVESFGCFLTEDGGSQGAVDFNGVSEDGAEVYISWAGDSPDSAMAELTTADGEEWRTVLLGAEVDVVVTDTSASVDTTLLGGPTFDAEEPFSATIACD